MINLGDKVKDSVSGFSGIVTCRHEYLNGCARLSVQPPVNKDGTLPDERTFDEPQLTVKKARAVREGSKKTGGPERSMPSVKAEGKR